MSCTCENLGPETLTPMAGQLPMVIIIHIFFARVCSFSIDVVFLYYCVAGSGILQRCFFVNFKFFFYISRRLP